jgi:hypothetical protein
MGATVTLVKRCRTSSLVNTRTGRVLSSLAR